MFLSNLYSVSLKKKKQPTSTLTVQLTLACVSAPQLFYSFFKSLVGKDVVVELKNDLRLVFVFNSLT